MGRKPKANGNWWDQDRDDYAPSYGRSPKKEETPPPNPEVMAALSAAMTDVRLAPLTAPLDPASLTRTITIVVDGQGLWEVKRNQIGMFVRKADRLPGRESFMRAGFALALPKLPFELYGQIVAFFREVNTRWKTEAYVQCWYRTVASGDGPVGYYLHVPLQDVSGGKVDHVGDHDETPSGSLVHVIDIHSHHTMGAYFSTTDDGDERRHDRLYGVVGNIDQLIPASKWRAASGGTFIDLKMEDVVETPDEELRFFVKLSDLLAAGARAQVTVGVDPFKNMTFPEEWLKQLVTTRKTGYAGFGGWFGHADREEPKDLPKGARAVIPGRSFYFQEDGHLWRREYLLGGGHQDTNLGRMDKEALAKWQQRPAPRQ